MVVSRFAGEAWQDKVARLRKELVEQGLYGMVVTEVGRLEESVTRPRPTTPHSWTRLRGC